MLLITLLKTREYLRSLPAGKWGEVNYTGAGIEGYGWGAIGIHLLLRYLMGLREHDEQTLMVAPMLPTVLRRPGVVYRAAPVQWGPYHLRVTCTVRTAPRYEMHITSAFWREEDDEPEVEQEWRWDGAWGEAKILCLREEQPADKKEGYSS